MDWREDALDRLLSEAWTRYAKSLESGEVLELESGYEEWVSTALNEAVKAQPDAQVA
jgi:hypothetical protein